MTVAKTRTVAALTFELMARKHAKDVGRRLRQRREELGLSQSQVAQRMPGGPIEAQRVSKWERGENKPNDENLERLATGLNVDVSYFYSDDPEPETGDLMGALDGRGAEILSLLRSNEERLARIEELLAARELEDVADQLEDEPPATAAG